jgi:hypothetical protein
VSENRVLRGIFGPKRKEVTGENYIMRSFVICIPHQILLRLQIRECDEMDGTCSTLALDYKFTIMLITQPEGNRYLRKRGLN